MTFIIGLAMTLLIYKLALKANKTELYKKIPPIIFAGIIIICLLKIFKIDYSTYKSGASLITLLLGPATIALAFPLVANIEVLTKHKRAIWSGLICATFLTIVSTFAIGKVFHLNLKIIMSMLPKSVTTPIAVEISKNLGGIPELTACLVILTGIVGAMAGHMILKWFKIKHDIAIGLSIGATSHVMGTASCLEKKKDKQTAISTLALIIVGIFTAILAPILMRLLG